VPSSLATPLHHAQQCSCCMHAAFVSALLVRVTYAC
jgi:hypothetical protein